MFQSPSESCVCPPSFRNNRKVTSPASIGDDNNQCHDIHFSDAALSSNSLDIMHGTPPPTQLHQRWSLAVEVSENGSFVHDDDDRIFSQQQERQDDDPTLIVGVKEEGTMNKLHSLGSHIKERTNSDGETKSGLTIPSLLPSKLLGSRKKKEKRKDEEGSLTSCK